MHSSHQRESSFTENELRGANSTFQEYIRFLRDFIIILMIVIIVRTFIITPFQINGQSMEASYHHQEFILVDKLSYLNFAYDLSHQKNDTTWGWLVRLWQSIPVHIGDPDRWDVVVIRPHVDANREYYIKRVIALPGDTILFENGQVYIKKEGSSDFIKIHEAYLMPSNAGQTYLPNGFDDTRQFTVPANTYWVMGDNRNNSADSRSCFNSCVGLPLEAHFIPRGDVVGKVFMDFWYFRIFRDKSLVPDWENIGWKHPPRIFSSPKTAQYPELD